MHYHIQLFLDGLLPFSARLKQNNYSKNIFPIVCSSYTYSRFTASKISCKQRNIVFLPDRSKSFGF